ncbi:MAG: DUF2849 domain-containing protein [Pseudomonadota bacterium]
MSRAFKPKVVTANHLLEGDVIYQTEDDGWSRCLSDAEVLTDEAHAELRLIDASRQGNVAVGAYLADIREGAEGPEPIHFREEFRRSGPSSYARGIQESFVSRT